LQSFQNVIPTYDFLYSKVTNLVLLQPRDIVVSACICFK